MGRICFNNNKLISDKALILMSVYQGEKYLRQQLDSLLSQTYPADILIRDDGSKDGTSDIIYEYQKKYSNIYYYRESNVGFIKSFNNLLSNKMVDDYQWIAFCDQDDVWLPDKVSVAVSKLKEYKNQGVPLLYCSNLTVVDSYLNRIRDMHKSQFSISRACLYVQNIAIGCTCVFNNAAVKAYRIGINNQMEAHDYYMLCVCELLGHVKYDFNSYILYRQHGDNTLGAFGKPVLRGIKDVITDFIKPQDELRVKMFDSFIETYHDYLTDKDIKFLSRFVNYKSILKNRFNLAFNPTIAGWDIKTTVAFNTRALLGRMY
jgi:rhamnosyltransferase